MENPISKYCGGLEKQAAAGNKIFSDPGFVRLLSAVFGFIFDESVHFWLGRAARYKFVA